MKHLARLAAVVGVLTSRPGVPAAAQAPQFDDNLIELTVPALNGLIRGLKVEIGLREEFKKELAKYPTPEQYATCQGQVMTSEAFMKIMEANSVPDNASPEEGKRIMTKLQDALQALRKKMCPLDPDDWTMERKAQRLKEIVERAAAASSPVAAAPGDEDAGPALGVWLGRYDAIDEGITTKAYDVAKERIAVYCAYTREHGVPGDDKLVKFPGKGNGIWWIYAPKEQQSLEAKCREIYPLVQQSNAYEPGGVNTRNL